MASKYVLQPHELDDSMAHRPGRRSNIAASLFDNKTLTPVGTTLV